MGGPRYQRARNRKIALGQIRQSRCLQLKQTYLVSTDTSSAHRLFFQRPARRIDNAVLSCDVEVGVHRQTDDLGREALAHGDASFADRIMLVRLLSMQRDRVVDGGRNALCLENGRQFVAPAASHPNGVLSPHGGGTREASTGTVTTSPSRSLYRSATLFRASISSGKIFSFSMQDCRLDGIETRSEADADIVIFITAVPMHAQASERVGHSVVIGHHCTAIAITTKRLGGEETGGGRVTKSTQSTVVVGRRQSPELHHPEPASLRLSRRQR